ncbi:hypothetical protein ACFXKD_17050 [Nocardiopsis aegyptia]|uniref:hypothetical protein n=1 Tax=Nocardiopsis aegyptia TaxID=220378 RepID=UPI003671BCC8
MNKARWIWAMAASIGILAALGAGLWFGGGPGTRNGWEAASWAAGIVAALALIATALTWAIVPRTRASAAPAKGAGSVVNTVAGDVTGGTVIQARDAHIVGGTPTGEPPRGTMEGEQGGRDR